MIQLSDKPVIVQGNTLMEQEEAAARGIDCAAARQNTLAWNILAAHNTAVPEIMIPLVGEVKELAYVKGIVCKVADEIIAQEGVQMHYKVGTMIEIPRAAVTADEIATEAEFFSFGTNDLTQMTFGFSRDDASPRISSTATTATWANARCLSE